MKGKVKIMAKEIKNVETKNAKVWTPNDTQKAFMSVLSKEDYISLKQAEKKLGKKIATGSINALGVNGKGLVESKADQVKYTAKIIETRVYADGTEIVIEKEKESYETGYKLV